MSWRICVSNSSSLRDFPFLKMSVTFVGPTQPQIRCIPRFFPGGKTRRELNHSPWIQFWDWKCLTMCLCLPLPPIWLNGVDRDNFTFLSFHLQLKTKAKQFSWLLLILQPKFISQNYFVIYERHLESKERFVIKKYLLIIGEKKNMQVLSHTFTYFST